MKYPAIYHDGCGKERTIIENDGKTLRMIIRGIEFVGPDFDMLEPVLNHESCELGFFTLADGCLCSCTIECQIPLPVVVGEQTVASILHVHLDLGDPKSRPLGGIYIDREDLKLTLTLGDAIFTSSGRSGWFEDELIEIQALLPEGTYMKACINCGLSDYSPAGHGLFGGLACFRGNKEGYRSVKSKIDLFRIWETMTDYVQETYLCPDFERRQPGTGYRG
jgi:hypothetical protein